MMMLLLLSVAASAFPSTGPLSVQVPATGQETGPTTPGERSLDELIESLPPTGREFLRDEDGSLALSPGAAEMQRRLNAGTLLTQEQWRRALLRTDALRYRSRWPLSEPFAVSMRRPAWLGFSQIRMLPRNRELSVAEVGQLFPFTCGTELLTRRREWLYQELGKLPLGPQELLFDVIIERGSLGSDRDPGAPPPGILWRGELALEVEVVEELDQAVPTASGPDVDQAVRDALSLAFDDWGRGRVALLVLDPNASEGSLLRDLGLSLEVEVLQGDEVMERFAFVAHSYDPLASASSVHGRADSPIAFRPARSIPTTLEHDPAQAEWSLRLRGTSNEVWGLWEARRRWSGSLEIPLAELIEREREVAPTGRGGWMNLPH